MNLGIDTSNYTTSVALYEGNEIYHYKKLLQVNDGRLGLRQSEAVFGHIKSINEVFDKAVRNFDLTNLKSIGVSVKPRDIEGSYMPCFLVGKSIANIIASVLDIECYEFSHQAGHIVSALHSVDRLDILDNQFIAFHVSGGTTEALLVTPDRESVIKTEIVSKTLDLNAGQVIDRVGNMLDFPFPSGRYIDNLSKQSEKEFKIVPCIKGNDCCLSGIENKCANMRESFKDEDIAKYVIDYILITLDKICEKLITKYGNMPVVFSGGVMSNSTISEKLSKKYNALFASPEFSSDNAAGVAILSKIKQEKMS